MRLPEKTAVFLLNTIQVTLQEIMRTVSGQYIPFNEANGQYYLDVKKDIDFDAQIRQRGELMGSDELNRYFFDALRQVLNLSDTTYVTGHRIWFYELPWTEARHPSCYLFFGAVMNARQPNHSVVLRLYAAALCRGKLAGANPGG